MPPIETIYLIHHSHTDIGYTHDQPVVWDMHTRFIDEALRLAEQGADDDSDGAFRWTVETTAILLRWLQHASTRDIERLQAMERAGRIEVTGMFLNMTPLYDADQIAETLLPLRRLRADYGYNIRHAMNCDVNGHNWPVVDLLLDAGIEGFTMAINRHFGGPLTPRPYPFLWEGPSGRTLPAYNGWEYSKGLHIGIGRDADSLREEWWPRISAYLESIQWPLPVFMIQSYHPFGDNGTAYNRFTAFINEWNAAGNTPRIVFGTPAMWWAAVAPHHDKLARWRGDWTDYWNFGSVSSAREQTLNRGSRARLRAADALYGALTTLPQPAQTPTSRWADQTFARYRDAAWDALHLWDEHTWGADCSISGPESDDAYAQWYHKANYAYQARSLSLMLARDALAELATHAQRDEDDALLLFNPLPWARTVAGPVPDAVRSVRGGAEDTTAGRHFQDRMRTAQPDQTQQSAAHMLRPVEVPAFGYTAIKRGDLYRAGDARQMSEAATVETARYRVTFDRDGGGIVSLIDKQLDCEWVDLEAGYPLNGFVRESVADTDHEWPRRLLFHMDWQAPLAEIPNGWRTGWRARRELPHAVTAHRVYHTPAGIEITQQLDAPGIEGPLYQRVFLPSYAEHIVCESQWTMGLTTHPEAYYVLFPFALTDPTARFDVGGQPIIPGDDQLPGCSRDYFTVQGWVDFAGAGRGVTVATPDNPMVQLGDFHFGDYQMDFKLARALLLGWVANNYWETNFRAHQPGRVNSRYWIQPYSGGFDEGRAHRLGLEASHAELMLQNLGEGPLPDAGLARAASLLDLPAGPVLPLHVKPAPDGGLIVRLFNASDAPQNARIGSAALRISGATACDLLETALEPLAVRNEAVTVEIAPRRIATIALQIAR